MVTIGLEQLPQCLCEVGLGWPGALLHTAVHGQGAQAVTDLQSPQEVPLPSCGRVKLRHLLQQRAGLLTSHVVGDVNAALDQPLTLTPRWWLGASVRVAPLQSICRHNIV